MSGVLPSTDSQRTAGDLPSITVTHCRESGRKKCPRCWHWTHTLNFDDLCNMCVGIILDDYPTHESAPFILANLKARGVEPAANPRTR